MFVKSLLAVVAVALSVSASPVNVGAIGTSESALFERSLVPEFLGLDKRESRAQAGNRIALAKSRAAKKAKRSFIEPDHVILKRAVDAMGPSPSSNLSKREIKDRALRTRALRALRCGSDRSCERAITSPSDLPRNGAAVCSPVTRRCAVGCREGFTLSSGVCVANANQCGPTICGPAPDGGIYGCTGANEDVCTVICSANLGYTRNSAGTGCFNRRIDPLNCGGEGNVCASSYNGVGEPRCINQKCQLTCPLGTIFRFSVTGEPLCG